jgi:poly(hydroxyalkanoate) granule-associated protein
MSDEQKPTINVTRGRNKGRGKSAREAAPESGGADLMGLASRAVQSVRNVWWAGLGVLAVAQETGAQVFDALVEEGKSWEQAQREQTEARRRQVQTLADEGAKAVEAVEQRVRDEVDEALRQVGVPRRRDLDELRERVNDLAQKLDRLSDAVEAEPRDEADA